MQINNGDIKLGHIGTIFIGVTRHPYKGKTTPIIIELEQSDPRVHTLAKQLLAGRRKYNME